MTRSNSATFSGLPSFILLTICDEYGITCDKSDEVSQIIFVYLWKRKKWNLTSLRVEVLSFVSKNTGKSYLFHMIPEPCTIAELDKRSFLLTL